MEMEHSYQFEAVPVISKKFKKFVYRHCSQKKENMIDRLHRITKNKKWYCYTVSWDGFPGTGNKRIFWRRSPVKLKLPGLYKFRHKYNNNQTLQITIK